MALDYEKLKKAAGELQARMARGGGPSLKFWKPAAGKNTIRILPPWTNEGELGGQFFREVHQHWNVSEGAGPVLCPHKTPHASDDKSCPICEFVDALKQRKGDVEAQELVKKMRAKLAYLMSVVDMSDQAYTAKDIAEWKKERPDSDCPFEVGDPKVQCYAATSTIAEQVMNIVVANEMDITDAASGYNVVLTKIPNKDPLKTRYTVTPELKPTKAPIPADFKLPDLSKIGKVHSYADMVKLLGEGPASDFSGLLPSDAGQRAEPEVQKKSSGKTKAAATSEWAGDDAGDDLAADMRKQLDA